VKRAASDVDDTNCVVIIDEALDDMAGLASGLESYGYGTASCSLEDWGQHVRQRSAAVVIGPHLSPRETWALCKDLRGIVTTPLVVLSASADPDHLSLAMDAGADYCFTATPDQAARLILAAIHAVERREQLARSLSDEVIEAGHLRIDLHRKTAEAHGRKVQLTATEFGILGVLARHPGRVVSASQILKQVQGYDADESMAQDIVKVHISRLRQKLEMPGETPSIINVRGQGYMYMFERRVNPRDE
jgi:DNA-binding response OmpR family regulator